MTRTIILFLFIVSAAMVAGCGAFVTPSNRLSSGALEIPPDLTAPNTIGATRVPNITGAPMSAQTVSEFEQFQSKEQLAEYQEFLEWRETHDDDDEKNIISYQEFKNNQRKAKLLRNGVLVVTDNIGRDLLLISDTIDSSWNRVDTALINLNLQLLNSSKSSHTFRLSYNVGRADGTDQGWRNWATRITGRAIYNLRLEETEEIVVASLYDRNNRPIVSPSAKSLLRRIAAQLRTFAGKQEQFVTGGTQPLPGLSLKKGKSGHMTLVVPGKPVAAWKRVSNALRGANFSIESRDKDALNFWIRYVELESKPFRSLLTRLGLKKERYPQVIDRYRIQLAAHTVGNATIVTVWDVTGRPSNSDEEILYIIFEKLKD